MPVTFYTTWQFFKIIILRANPACLNLDLSFLASAIKCWVCRSDLDPRCVDPFDNTTLPIYDCAVEHLEHLPGVKATMCRKIRQKGDNTF